MLRRLISPLAPQFPLSAWAGRVINWLALPVILAGAMFGVGTITFAQTTPNALLGTWVGRLKYRGEAQQLAAIAGFDHQ
jgi:hypothetical protein